VLESTRDAVATRSAFFGSISPLPTPPPHAETITTYGCTTLESRLEAERRKERTRELQQAKEEGFAARALRSATSWLW
jgi:hypothetical protein